MTKMKILVPVDFKDEPIVVFDFLSKLGHANHELEITLLHVVEFPLVPGSYVQPADYLGEFYQRHIENYSAKLKNLATNSWFNGMSVKTRMVTDNFAGPGEEIAAYAEKDEFDLVVLYSRHRKGLQNFFTGSELLRIVRFCKVPMVIFSPERLPKFHRIAFATDFSEESAQFYSRLKPITKLLGGRLLCFNINTQTDFRDQRKFINDRNHFLNMVGTADGVEISLYNAVDVTNGIINFAEDNVANFIALGTHGRKGLSRLYYGSITEDIIKSTTYPLIVINLGPASKTVEQKSSEPGLMPEPKK